MPEPTDIAELSWTDYSRILQSRDPPILIPVGATEQHGPHLPLSTDTLLPTAVCRGVAARTGALVAPSICYGCKSWPRTGGGQHFVGTTSLDAATVIGQLKDLVREFARHGVRKLAFVVGHMENQSFVIEGCDLALREARAFGYEPPRIMTVGYWEFVSPATIAKVWGDQFPNWALEHAGIMETSMMLHLHPEMVHMDRLEDQAPADFPVHDMWPYDPRIVPASGILNTAKGSTAEKGALFFGEFVDRLSDAVGGEFGSVRR
jgi:creatinine amidohydrolase